MAKKVRWGRVGAAFSALVCMPTVFALMAVPDAVWEAPLGDECQPEFKLAQAKVERAQRARSPEQALDLALEVMEAGVAMQQRGTLLHVAVGSAQGMLAVPVVQEALESRRLTDAARAQASARLDALAHHSADRAHVESREYDVRWSALGETARQGLWRQVLPAAWWVFWGDDTEALIRITDEILAESRRVRNEASGLALLGQLQDYRDHRGFCPTRLQDVGDVQGDPPFTYDADRCELAINTHPDAAPRIYRAH